MPTQPKARKSAFRLAKAPISWSTDSARQSAWCVCTMRIAKMRCHGDMRWETGVDSSDKRSASSLQFVTRLGSWPSVATDPFSEVPHVSSPVVRRRHPHPGGPGSGLQRAHLRLPIASRGGRGDPRQGAAPVDDRGRHGADAHAGHVQVAVRDAGPEPRDHRRRRRRVGGLLRHRRDRRRRQRSSGRQPALRSGLRPLVGPRGSRGLREGRGVRHATPRPSTNSASSSTASSRDSERSRSSAASCSPASVRCSRAPEPRRRRFEWRPFNTGAAASGWRLSPASEGVSYGIGGTDEWDFDRGVSRERSPEAGLGEVLP
jgi:hypothetical protein